MDAVRYDIYSRTGRLLDSKETQVDAERRLGEWFNAKFIVGVAADGTQSLVAERKELI